jgi:hypothetical protein
MTKSSVEQFEERRAFVALFRMQVALLSEADPTGFGQHAQSMSFDRYDRLLAEGPAARWPRGYLTGLKQGIRDLQVMLDMAYPAPQRAKVRQRLRLAGGAAAELLEAGDERRLATIRKRGRIRTEDEYYLVVAAIDRLEGVETPDEAALAQLRNLADRSSVG